MHIYALDEMTVFLCLPAFLCLAAFLCLSAFLCPSAFLLRLFCLIALLVGEVPQVEEGGS